MRQRSFIVVALAITLLVVGAVGVYAYDRTRDDVIAKGVKAGGVDLSGLSPTKARQVLRRQIAAPLAKPVRVRYHGHRYKLSARRAEVSVDVDQMVDEALEASRRGNLISRTTRAITGGSVNENVPVAMNYSRRAVARFARRVKRRIDEPAVDASIDFSSGQLVKVDSQTGHEADAGRLQRAIEGDLTEPTADRKVKAPVAVTKPKVTTRELAERYPRVITINRGGFQLTLYEHLKPARTYPIAVGQAGLETPAGRYAIQDKQINPSWHVPNSAWAGSLAGRVIPPGPGNPLQARWMGIAGGAGIHGTADVGSLGTAASHGCIRMSVPEVIELFDRVEVGDPFFVA
jgi:lipoprotein-anchoring transpeptidase ErfK/SrfK